jgi:hypothetical protein
VTQEHPALAIPKEQPQIVETAIASDVDLSRVKEKANRITETLNRLVEETEAELDSIEQRVLELVAIRLEKAK